MPGRAAFYRTDYAWSQNKIFHYGPGDDILEESVVIDPATVAADANGNKVLTAGSLLTKITASGAYGPYSGAAADGRQTLGVAPQCVILSQDLDVTTGPEAIGGIWGNAVFESANLILFGAVLADVKTAMPRCDFF